MNTKRFQSPHSQSPDKPVISVIFSFWNEEEVLPELIARTRAVFAQLLQAGRIGGYEMIFVNDASTDRSEEILLRESQGMSDLRVLNMTRNFGVSPCVLAGMQFARGDAVVYMDADLQDPPEVIPELIQAWHKDPEAEVVHTKRLSRDGETRIKKLITNIGYKTLRAVSTIDLPLEAGDFKLLSRRAVDELLRFKEKRPFLRGLVCWIGFKQTTVFYHRAPRHSGKTKFPVLGYKVIRNFLDSAVIAFSDVPLKFSSLFGVVVSVLAFCYLVGILIAWAAGHDIPGWSATLTAVLFLGGIQLLSIGILGNYISSIFLEAKGRPNFIVKNTHGFSRADHNFHEAPAEDDYSEGNLSESDQALLHLSSAELTAGRLSPESPSADASYPAENVKPYEVHWQRLQQ